MCAFCGEEYGSVNSNNHTKTVEWVQTKTEHMKKYTCCGKVVVATEKHQWKDGRCKTCNYVCEHTGGTATCSKRAVCIYCGDEYGELNSQNHGILKHVPAKPATKHTDGNIEYWCCENCHRYYSDAMAFKEIKKKAIKIAAKKKNAEQQKTGTTKKKINTSTKANTEGNTKTSGGTTANTGVSESPDTGDQNNPALALTLVEHSRDTNHF